MLNQLKEDYQGAYTKEHVRELEQMETLLRMDRFDSGDALRLGNQIVREAEKYGEDLIVRIIRMTDELPVFQYVGKDRGQRNIDFAMKKSKTVMATGHCSLWALVKELTDGGVDTVFFQGSDCLPVGGAFPVFVDDKLSAVVTTSGLHKGMDHVVVVEAVCAVKKVDIPVFSGRYI